jgi:hypothetical protein
MGQLRGRKPVQQPEPGRYGSDQERGSQIEFFLFGQSGIRTKLFEAKQGYKSVVILPEYLEQSNDWVQVENNASCITYLNLRHVTGFRCNRMGNGSGVILRVREFDDAFRISLENPAFARLKSLHQLPQISTVSN